MAAQATSILQRLDSQLESILADWNIYTTILATVLVLYLISPLFFYTEPDAHPLLLARQCSASYVRQPKESAIFRSSEIPHGYPLKSGLNVKDPGQPKWTSGRDGDLRDVWKRAVSGPTDADGKPTGGEVGKVITMYGKEETIEYDFTKLSSEINAVGQHVKAHGGSRVAIHMHNSVELLVTFFGKLSEALSQFPYLTQICSLCLLWPDAYFDPSTKIPRYACCHTGRDESGHLSRWCRFTATERALAKVSSAQTGHLGGGADEQTHGLERGGRG